MRQVTKSAIFGFLVVSSICALAKHHEAAQHAPLPAKVIAAKTIFIQNDSGRAEIADKAYQAINAWGRYQIVDSSANADLILILTVSTGQRSTSEHSSVSTYNAGSGTWTYGSVDSPGTQTSKFTQVELVDPVTHDTEWTDERPWGRKSATQELIKGLRQRVEYQTSQQGLAASPRAH
jgi:hypothetical protein